MLCVERKRGSRVRRKRVNGFLRKAVPLLSLYTRNDITCSLFNPLYESVFQLVSAKDSIVRCAGGLLSSSFRPPHFWILHFLKSTSSYIHAPLYHIMKRDVIQSHKSTAMKRKESVERGICTVFTVRISNTHTFCVIHLTTKVCFRENSS